MPQLTTVTLPQYVPFPVTIATLNCQVGETVPKHKQLFTYKYWDHEDDPSSTEDPPLQKKVERVGTFESPIEGEIEQVNIKIGQQIHSSSSELISLREPCDHSVQYGGLCALCGKAVEDEKDYTGYNYEDRAQIEMSHDSTGLKISYDEAAKIEQNTTDRLLDERKLILVVDLDQTVIHATVDPTVGEWQSDPLNPNYKSVKDVKSFCLEEEPIMPPGWTGPKFTPTKCWYYVKLRPGLEDFLKKISNLYELHIYTMATRNYALAIAKIIDPTGEYFGDRILSRDESGSLTHKNLKRLFPVDQSMVAIIDDRGDVWQWESNLVKVVPYDFFVGIGDINSSFLPKKNGQLIGPSKKRKSIAKLEEQNEEETGDDEDEEKEEQEGKEDGQVEKDEETNGEELNHSPVERILQLGGGEDNTNLLLEQSITRNISIEQQQHDRPLAKLQHDLEMIQEDEKNSDGASEDLKDDSGTPSTDLAVDVSENAATPAPEQNLLYDDDTELFSLEKALERIHSKYYEILEKNTIENLQLRPDLTLIIPSLKHRCLEGVTVLFSGILPLGINLERADIVIWCKQFGVKVVNELYPEVTHVVCRDNRSKAHKIGPTFKVRVARKLIPDVKIVNPDWLFACLSSWSKVDEVEYLIESSDKDWYISDRELLNYKDFLSQQREKVNDRSDSVVDYSLDGVEDEVDEFLAGISDDDEGDDDDDDDNDEEKEEEKPTVDDDMKIEPEEKEEGKIFEDEERKKGILKRNRDDDDDEKDYDNDKLLAKRNRLDSNGEKSEEEDEEQVDLDKLEQELLDGFDGLEE